MPWSRLIVHLRHAAVAMHLLARKLIATGYSIVRGAKVALALADHLLEMRGVTSCHID